MISEISALELEALTKAFDIIMEENFPDTSFDPDIREEYWQIFAGGYRLGKHIAEERQKRLQNDNDSH